MFGLAAAIISSNKGRHLLAWICGLWVVAAIAIWIICRLPLVLIPSLLLLVLSLSLSDKTQAGKPAMYYCRSCGFTGYQKAKKFELRCPKCKAPLMRTDTSRESWNALSQEEREVLQAQWSGKTILPPEPKAAPSPMAASSVISSPAPDFSASASSAPVSPSEIRYPDQPERMPEAVAYCRRCGRRIPEGSRFCQYCGLLI